MAKPPSKYVCWTARALSEVYHHKKFKTSKEVRENSINYLIDDIKESACFPSRFIYKTGQEEAIVILEDFLNGI